MVQVYAPYIFFKQATLLLSIKPHFFCLPSSFFEILTPNQLHILRPVLVCLCVAFGKCTCFLLAFPWGQKCIAANGWKNWRMKSKKKTNARQSRSHAWAQWVVPIEFGCSLMKRSSAGRLFVLKLHSFQRGKKKTTTAKWENKCVFPKAVQARDKNYLNESYE